MKIEFSKIMSSKSELEKLDRTNPYNVVAMFANTICNYDVKDDSNFIEMLQYLMGDNQPISNLMKQQIKDRMTQNDKYGYIGKSYFEGATPDNDYTPSTPYVVNVTDNPYTDENEGYKRLFLKSGGADSERPVTVRLAKDGNYYIWSDSFMGLLSDIRKPESSNPWA